MSALTLDKEAESSDKAVDSGGPARGGETANADAPALGGEVEPAVVPASAEVAIHELGESLAATVASVQGEMARYNSALGTYVLDEIDISIPVMLRVTKLGQVMARVTDSQSPDSAVGQIRLRLKPSTGAAPVATPNGAAQPLHTVDFITRDALARLSEERVFSVGDLLRVASTAAGREALAREVFGFDLQAVLDRAALVSLPLPSGVGTLLLKLGVTSPEQFLKSDPAQLADTMRGYASLPVSAADISQWQEAAAAYMDALPLYR
jgi:hypothetical protein